MVLLCALYDIIPVAIVLGVVTYHTYHTMSATMSSSSLIPQSLLSAQRELDFLTALGCGTLPSVLSGGFGSSASSSTAVSAALESVTTTASSLAPGASEISATASDVRRLEIVMREVTELNERVMAQNISLMADLESAQRAVRELRAGKDALATQLKRLLIAKEVK